MALTSAGETLARCACATRRSARAALAEQHVEVDGRRYGHVIDPRTGWPAEGVRSATAIDGEAAVADALATAFLVGGEASHARSAPRGRARWRSSRSSASRASSRVIGDRDGVGIEPAAGLALREDEAA